MNIRDEWDSPDHGKPEATTTAASNPTPGPWRVDPKRELRVCTLDDDTTIAATGCDDGQREAWEANARLIAAAPDLLNAVRFLLSNPDNRIAGPDLRAAQAAIAKATGETK